VERPRADREVADLSARDQNSHQTHHNDYAGSEGPSEAFSGAACAEQAHPGHAASPNGSAATQAKRHRFCADHAIHVERYCTGTNNTYPGGIHAKRFRSQRTDAAQANRYRTWASCAVSSGTNAAAPARQGPRTG
jgi:hypothetical protein